MSIRVLLVDDHALVRAGLASLLEDADQIDVVGEAEDGARAIELAASLRPDVVLMDLSMPVMDGVEATRRLLAEQPGSTVLVLTSSSGRSSVQDALAAGATGYLLKDADPRDLVAGIHAAARGDAPLDPRVARTLLPGAAPDPAALLSPREREVLLLVARGLANKQIGRTLGITERTVKVHLGNAFKRIGVSDRTSAALWVRDHLPAED
ncbi:response regulator [Cryptosporangium arvum]|uniref:response regulator n=1 Tax=Cryptosporangium arvum TaxID=80871 RepID=UPI0004BC3431|nr:response regulator transcription factor [Cryptosporangium arvum]